MSISWLLTNLVATFLLPPLNGLLLAGLGWAVWYRRPRLARGLVGVGLLLLVILSMPVVGDVMLRSLEGEPVSVADLQRAQAIVVLGGGRYRDAPEYGADTAGEPTLIRLRYAARLHRSTGLPILVSGGKPDGDGLSEAEVMRRVLVEEFGVPVRWSEGASDNTQENATRSVAMIKASGISRVALVTHAWHVPRAGRAFRGAGIEVLPAPTAFSRESVTPLDFLPQVGGLRHSRWALHEWIGLLWYRLRG